MQQLYYLIRNEQLVPSVAKLPVYTDSFKMFTKYPDDPKTHLFLESLAKNGQTMKVEEIYGVLTNPTRDGKKDVINSLIHNCQRKSLLQQGAESTCSHCSQIVLRRVFFMVSEMLTVELKERTRQIEKMVKEGTITTRDAMDMSEMITSIVRRLDHLISKADKTTTNKSELVESVFKLLIHLVNEVMMKYVLNNKIKSAMDNNEAIELLL